MKKEKQKAPASKRKSRAQQIWHQFKKNKGAVIGLIVLGIVIIIAIYAQIKYDFVKDICGMNIMERLQKPNPKHPFGTDQAGRDVMARIFYGTRYSLIIGFLAVGISVVLGTGLGAIAGYYGGAVETVIMRIVELFLLIPSMLLAIVLLAAFGIRFSTLIIALGISTVPHFARNARASVMTVCGNEYVEAAKAIGVSNIVIIFRHVLPNALSPILVQATTRMAQCIVSAATFSFMGLGVPAPTPEWGAMLSDAKQYMREFPHLIIFPGLAILITSLAINLVGDGLRDALDPKLKR